jgi:toxin ParE1/3/4
MIRIHPAAVRDLDEQAAYYTGRGSPGTANRWLDRAAATFEFVAKQPGIGAAWQSRKRELAAVRMWLIEGFERHLVFYRPIADGIEVLRVVHGASDLGPILGDD